MIVYFLIVIKKLILKLFFKNKIYIFFYSIVLFKFKRKNSLNTIYNYYFN